MRGMLLQLKVDSLCLSNNLRSVVNSYSDTSACAFFLFTLTPKPEHGKNKHTRAGTCPPWDTHTCAGTSSHLPPCISALINNWAGFCLFLSRDTVYLYRLCHSSCKSVLEVCWAQRQHSNGCEKEKKPHLVHVDMALWWICESKPPKDLSGFSVFFF